MPEYTVGIARYENSPDSLHNLLRDTNALGALKGNEKVFIKPNIVVWTEKTIFPKWGVVTTSRVIKDIVLFLKELGIKDITIAEGIVPMESRRSETFKHAMDYLGYDSLAREYGVKLINIMERPFESVDLGDGIQLNINSDVLSSDFLVNVPVLKTHAQAVVSLGLKNVKGFLNVSSRKKCHSPEAEKPLDFYISRIIKAMPPSATIIDGIFSLERGPLVDGKARRSNILIASNDPLSADLAGAMALGYEPSKVLHISLAAQEAGRKTDLSDIKIIGEALENVSSFHEFDFQYNNDNTLIMGMEKRGIKGISYRKYDDTLCTYCSTITGALMAGITMAWNGVAWDDVEVLTGKKMAPSTGKKKTILLGECMCKLHKDNTDINEMLPIRGCPPSHEDAFEAFKKAGIELHPELFNNIENGLGFFMKKYKDKPEFDESFFRIGI